MFNGSLLIKMKLRVLVFIFTLVMCETGLNEALSQAVKKAREDAIAESFHVVPVYPDLIRFMPFVEHALMDAASKAQTSMTFPQGIIQNDTTIMQWETTYGEHSLTRYRRRTAMEKFKEEWDVRHPDVHSKLLFDYTIRMCWDGDVSCFDERHINLD